MYIVPISVIFIPIKKLGQLPSILVIFLKVYVIHAIDMQSSSVMVAAIRLISKTLVYRWILHLPPPPPYFPTPAIKMVLSQDSN